MLARLETARRLQAVISHDVIAGLYTEDPAAIGGPVTKVVADWLRITPTDARRRLRDAQQLSARTTLTGQVLPPELPATARAWRDGQLDGQHLRVIATFVRDLPQDTAPQIVAGAEKLLAHQALQLRPDQLEKAAHRCALLINPDGRFSDADQARQRGFTWCAQRRDGMSIGKLIATPELRANLDAWLARFAAPGMCNPDNQTPCVTDEPTEDAAATDARRPAQRQHDALNALVRGQLGDPALGHSQRAAGDRHRLHHPARTHRGHRPRRHRRRDPAPHARCHPHGPARLPLSGGFRRALQPAPISGAHPAHRLARPARGPLRRRARLHPPRCDAPGYWCEVHHLADWAAGGPTDVDNLTFACTPHHRLAGKSWQTIKLPNSRTAWLPPPQLRRGARTNDYHHPERLLDDRAAPD